MSGQSICNGRLLASIGTVLTSQSILNEYQKWLASPLIMGIIKWPASLCRTGAPAGTGWPIGDRRLSTWLAINNGSIHWKGWFKKFQYAKKGLAKMKLAYDGLAISLNVQSVREWKEQEQQAINECGDLLWIYDQKLEKGGAHQWEEQTMTKVQKPHPRPKFNSVYWRRKRMTPLKEVSYG